MLSIDESIYISENIRWSYGTLCNYNKRGAALWRSEVCVGVPTTGGEVHTFGGVTSVDI